MLSLFLVSFVVIALVVVGMAVGVMNGREPIKGSCGGLNRLGMRDGECPICGDNPTLCESETATTSKRPTAAELGRQV
ncbi:hypothetical protein DFR26_1642 [Paraperlucidibaca baekdonensis]|uniref:ApbE family protein n=1 Tax=Paraperlucidibaca baekdonensis TaxID=748120 RepID=A0A3E0H3H8_9GAMM|nr:(Na+)-NQR maturation NqrM [Paraperlucidibaca baekdonensis]REH37858.1 hypothetical protein DFR26_1642 [Paraperlucidibaca baekdonensis]